MLLWLQFSRLVNYVITNCDVIHKSKLISCNKHWMASQHQNINKALLSYYPFKIYDVQPTFGSNVWLKVSALCTGLAFLSVTFQCQTGKK